MAQPHRHRRRRASAVIGVALLAGLVIGGTVGPLILRADPFDVAGAALLGPSAAHPFGTDDLGRDVLAGVVYGAWSSLHVALVAAALTAGIGLSVGGLAGLRGGVTDHVLMRGTEFVQALPRFFVVLVIVSLFGGDLRLIAIVIGLTAWPATARLFRMQVLSTSSREFVLAARAAGAGDLAVLRRHVLPVTVPVVAAELSYQAGSAMLAEAGLSFLGLGDPTVMSWGTLLGSAQHFVREAWWMSVFPGLAVTTAVLGCNLIADSLVVTE